MPRLSRLSVALAFACLGLASSAQASTIGVTGTGNILVPNGTPNTGMTANFFDDVGTGILIHAWDELQNVLLGSSITVDFTALGTHTGVNASENAVIAAGTRISSHYLYFDPLDLARATATFTFDQDIIGIIVFSDLPRGDRLLATDFLRNPLTVAPGVHFVSRGFETVDSLTLLDSRHLLVDLEASNPGNQLRVITASPIPEPASLLLVGSSLGWLAVRRRRPNRPAA